MSRLIELHYPMPTIKEHIKSDMPVLVDFYAIWCSTCKTMAPILQAVINKTDDKILIIKVDVDKEPEIANEYRVKEVPTLMLYNNGELKWQHSGIISENILINIIEKCLEDGYRAPRF